MNEAENLARLFEELKRDKKLSRAAFARTYKLPDGKKLNETMINQHVKGDRPISLEYAQAYALGFGLSLKEVSPSNYKRINVIDHKIDNELERQLLMFFREMTEDHRDDLLAFASNLHNIDSPNNVQSNPFGKKPIKQET